MSPAVILATLQLEEPENADRRSHRRYPIVLDLQFRSRRGRAPRFGIGTTVNVSSRGVLFKSADAVPAGVAVELTLSWPFLLAGACPMKLVMHGRVVRSDGRGIAFRAKDYEFRTAGVKSSMSSRPKPERRSA